MHFQLNSPSIIHTSISNTEFISLLHFSPVIILSVFSSVLFPVDLGYNTPSVARIWVVTSVGIKIA